MDLRHPGEHQALVIEPWALLVEHRALLTGLRHFRAFDSITDTCFVSVVKYEIHL